MTDMLTKRLRLMFGENAAASRDANGGTFTDYMQGGEIACRTHHDRHGNLLSVRIDKDITYFDHGTKLPSKPRVSVDMEGTTIICKDTDDTIVYSAKYDTADRMVWVRTPHETVTQYQLAPAKAPVYDAEFVDAKDDLDPRDVMRQFHNLTRPALPVNAMERALDVSGVTHAAHEKLKWN